MKLSKNTNITISQYQKIQKIQILQFSLYLLEASMPFTGKHNAQQVFQAPVLL